jgi:hypothetical protein
MLWEEEVPHEIRKDFFLSVYSEGWDVGRDEEKRCYLLCCLKVDCSPGRILGWVNIVAVFLEEISSFFIPSPLCHAFLPGNRGIIYVIYKFFYLCMALLTGNNEMHK